MAHDVFISYSRKDEEIALLICSTLEESGLICWIAPRDVQPGKKYAREIVSAIQECFVMLLIFSESSNKSEHVENEIDISFNEGKTIIPFKITDTQMSPELKYYLNKKHWIDGVPEPEKCFEKLVEQISLSIPHRSKDLREEEVIKSLDKLLEEYMKKGSIEKLISLQKRFDTHLKPKPQENPEGDAKFQELLDEFIATELNNTRETEETSDNSVTRGNEGRYDILQNGVGEILIIIKARPGDPDNPRLVYDGGPRALLYRSRESSVMLGEINIEARRALRAVDEVLMVEIRDDEVIREYTVPTRNVRSLDALLDIAKEEIAKKR